MEMQFLLALLEVHDENITSLQSQLYFVKNKANTT